MMIKIFSDLSVNQYTLILWIIKSNSSAFTASEHTKSSLSVTEQ